MSDKYASPEIMEIARSVAELDTSQDCDPAHHALVVRAMNFLDTHSEESEARDECK